MLQVLSESIHSVYYDEEEKLLEIRFNNSKFLYVYYDFPKEEYQAFIQSDSLGRFYAHQIKGYYASCKVASMG